MSFNINSINSINLKTNNTYNILPMKQNQFPTKNNKNFSFQNLLENSAGNNEILNKFIHSNDFEFSFGENLDTKRANILEQNNALGTKTANNQREEYFDLSFSNGNMQNQEIPKRKKSLELDFKIKYKTEKCKFWEINQTCKFGDSVKILFFFYFFISLILSIFYF